MLLMVHQVTAARWSAKEQEFTLTTVVKTASIGR